MLTHGPAIVSRPARAAAAAGPTPLSVVAAPTALTWGPDGAGGYITGNATATATGGTAPYTYSWVPVSGGQADASDATATANFYSDTGDAAVVQCEVNDAALATAVSNTVTIS